MPRTAPDDFAAFAASHLGRRVFLTFEDRDTELGERTAIGVLEAVGAATLTLRDSTGRQRMVRLDRVLTLEDRSHAQHRPDHARA